MLDEPKRIAGCREQLFAMLKPAVPDLKLFGSIHGLCYAEINEEDTLVEFGIRRSAFLNQQAETPVMLWMVVGITLSGVLLAAMQLAAAYRLASSGKAAFEQGGQLSVENNRISLNSSVTGLLILAISLAFFYIFVSQVYLIKEVGDAPLKSMAGSPDLAAGWGENQSRLDLKGGGVGPPPPQLLAPPKTPKTPRNPEKGAAMEPQH